MQFFTEPFPASAKPSIHAAYTHPQACRYFAAGLHQIVFSQKYFPIGWPHGVYQCPHPIGGIPGCMHGGGSPDTAKMVVKGATRWDQYVDYARALAQVENPLKEEKKK